MYEWTEELKGPRELWKNRRYGTVIEEWETDEAICLWG